MRFIICFIAFPRKYLLSCSINRKRLKAFRFGHKEFKLCACFGRLAVLLSFPKRSGYIDSVISMMGDPESEEDAFKLICFVKYYMTVRSFSLSPLDTFQFQIPSYLKDGQRTRPSRNRRHVKHRKKDNKPPDPLFIQKILFIMPVFRIIFYRNQKMYFYSIMNSLRSPSPTTLCNC